MLAGRAAAAGGLIRRAYTRGLGEPDADESFAPQALSFLDPGGEERFEPYGYDLLRLHESRVTVERRSLLVDSERGRAHQAPAGARRDAGGGGRARARRRS